jgi:hypothetical protein
MELSDKIVKWHNSSANINGISSALPEDPFGAWLKELDQLNKELGIVK